MRAKRDISFSSPDITEEEIREVAEVLRTGRLTTGAVTAELEKQMAVFCGTNRMVCLNSATACMELTYRLFGIGEGDEVITTVYTHPATLGAICHTGARPVLVDILGDRVYDEKAYVGHSPYEPDYDAVEDAITSRTKAVVPVDIGGVMCDYDRLREIAEAHRIGFKPSDNRYQQALGRILILADSAHGFGASRRGRMSGQCADVTSFSFQAENNLTTAEGGGVTWRSVPGIPDDEIACDYRRLTSYGQTEDEAQIFGYKCNMTELSAAIGLVQLRRYPALLKRRREIVGRYDAGINRINGREDSASLPITSLAHYTENSTSSGHLYLTRLGHLTEQERGERLARMAEQGVEARVHYKPLAMLAVCRNMGFRPEDYPRACAYYVNEITLPLHTLLTDEDVDTILEVLESVCL